MLPENHAAESWLCTAVRLHCCFLAEIPMTLLKVVKESHYIFNRCPEVLRSLPQDRTESSPAASTAVVHSGIPNSSGAVAINNTASIAEIRQLATLR